MTVKSVRMTDPLQAFVGLSSETKPLEAEDWALFIERDTGARFRMWEGAWIPDPTFIQPPASL